MMARPFLRSPILRLQLSRATHTKGHLLRLSPLTTISKSFAIHRERMLIIPTKFELLRELARYVLNLLWGERLRKLERLFPMQQVATHLEGRDGSVRLQEVILKHKLNV